MGTEDEFDVSQLLIEMLTDHGFEQRDDRPSEFVKILDSQHALFVKDAGWDQRQRRKNAQSARLELAVARRDINELWRDLLNPDIHEWRGTVPVNKALFGDDYRQAPMYPSGRFSMSRETGRQSSSASPKPGTTSLG